MRNQNTVSVAAIMVCGGLLVVAGCASDECVEKCEQHYHDECGNEDWECDADSMSYDELDLSSAQCPNVEGGVCDRLYNLVVKYHECKIDEGCYAPLSNACQDEYEAVMEVLHNQEGYDCYDL